MPRAGAAKPEYVFGRQAEWAALASFAASPVPRALLGVISGRRRMGKTYLLRALVEQLGGLYFAATAATEGESLRRVRCGAGRACWLIGAFFVRNLGRRGLVCVRAGSAEPAVHADACSDR